MVLILSTEVLIFEMVFNIHRDDCVSFQLSAIEQSRNSKTVT